MKERGVHFVVLDSLDWTLSAMLIVAVVGTSSEEFQRVSGGF